MLLKSLVVTLLKMLNGLCEAPTINVKLLINKTRLDLPGIKKIFRNSARLMSLLVKITVIVTKHHLIMLTTAGLYDQYTDQLRRLNATLN